MSASIAAFERPRALNSNSSSLRVLLRGLVVFLMLVGLVLQIFKSGNLFISSKAVVVREDKKLLTVLFPDGRAFTLKTTDDRYVWKTALEHALAQAPSAALVMGHNVIFRSDTNDTVEGSFRQWREKCPVKSLVVGCSILLGLEDIDGGPSFLEKALRFLEKYVDDSLHRCSMSADSQTDTSGSRNTIDDDHPVVKVIGYDDAEHEVNPEADYDHDRRLSGKLSESSGSASSDMYDYKNDDSYDGSPMHALTLASINPELDYRPHSDSSSVNDQDQQKKTRENMPNASAEVLGNESLQSMGDILSSMDQELHHSFPGPKLLPHAPMPKLTNSNPSAKKSTFWRRRSASKTPSTESIDYSGEEELAIQKLEIAKNDLRHRIAKEARGNAILQASLERRKQALHERRLALEQDVARLQEQLQAERDLRAALEVGLSMYSAPFSGSPIMDQTRAELEEIALAEADVAKLKQKVAELHHQLNQQRQHHYGSLSDATDRYQHAPNQNSQQDLMGPDLRNIRQLSASGSSNQQPIRKQFMESANLIDPKSNEASKSVGALDSAPVTSTSRVAEVKIKFGMHLSTYP
ncbi:hypothetical protein OROGR_016763 [Orobanche gracilis]